LVSASDLRSNNQCRDLTIAMLSLDELPEMMQEIASETTLNPEEESAVLNDLASVSSDLIILFALETVILRLSAVIGKILELISDYLPDHSLRSDELAFNVHIMATSIFLLARSASLIIQAQFIDLNDLDHVAYDLCFQSVAVTLL